MASADLHGLLDGDGDPDREGVLRLTGIWPSSLLTVLRWSARPGALTKWHVFAVDAGPTGLAMECGLSHPDPPESDMQRRRIYARVLFRDEDMDCEVPAWSTDLPPARGSDLFCRSCVWRVRVLVGNTARDERAGADGRP